MRFIYSFDSGTMVFRDRNVLPDRILACRILTIQTNRITALLFKISVKITITSLLLGVW